MHKIFEKIVNGILKLFKSLENTRIHYVLLSIGIVFVILSMLLDRYFFEAFFTLIYGIGVAYLMLVRKHETIGKFTTGTVVKLVLYLVVFGLWFLFWIIGIWMYSEYFPQKLWFS